MLLMTFLIIPHLVLGLEDLLLCFFLQVLYFDILRLSPWSIFELVVVYGVKLKSKFISFFA